MILAFNSGALAQGGQGSSGQSEQAAQGKDQSEGASVSGQADSQPGRAGADSSPRVSSQVRSTADEATATGVRAELEFNRWLASYLAGGELEGTRSRLETIAVVAMNAGVPADAFKARIREAVAKRATPETMLRAIEEDARRWIWLAGQLDGSAWPPGDRAAELYLSASTALRNGVAEASVAGLLSWAGDTSADAAKAGAALTTAASLSMPFRDAATGDAALTLLRSRLRVRQYSAVVELAVRAQSAGFSSRRFLEALEATLGQGGSLRDLERALFG